MRSSNSRAATVTVPAAPDGFGDRFVGNDAEYYIQSLGLQSAAPDVVRFDSYNMDNLNDYLESFSTLQMAQ